MKTINFSMDDEIYEEFNKLKEEYSKKDSWLKFFYFKVIGKRLEEEYE